MSYEIKIDAFEGPIPLLLHLIKKDEVEIYDISISEITEQYLNYIAAMQELNLEIASEFLIMAANLIEMKSKMLLPDDNEDEDEEEIDPRQQLINRLLEYKKYKELADSLRDYEETQRKRYTRNMESILAEIESDEIEVNPLENISLNQFVDTFEKILKTKTEEKEDDEEESEDKLSHVNREDISIKDKIVELTAKVEEEKEVKFDELFVNDSTKLEIVVTFMAILELIKLHKIGVRQNGVFGQIDLYLLKERVDNDG
ncbi:MULTISPECIES: segregation and condensation protein A [unclassified Candidatus Frackibacter]|uniref:segregation and condensation protein A n=1 Tax=unclassified Candidatus Frackibacter TaxID=2648818 RepID=UPI00079BE5EE|nr:MULTISPECIES: segregation/condensation protein A [unclassified Candidatus Frackibacter]KXS43776.1 MAG: segregation and condensation protein A [Candidatus Frackibacter sp. T328-2]SDC01348.1 condensin subunit ScpA [Candidatus Frackibacter sp. WG11]SEM32584.1 condensin subunit ScpA [Candidatus Frackibacter sp. WG12]SFL37556.1 condensin subunit ScpA [Candidatus Frackibacter sp. WG13]